MKDVSGGRGADESRPLSCTRRPGPRIRRTLAGTFLAAIMLGWPVVMAGGRAAGAPRLTANQSSERITADPGAPTGLTARAGDAQVTLFVDRARIRWRRVDHRLQHLRGN